MPSAAKLAGSIAGFLAEGDIHAKRGDWQRACNSYSKVIKVDADHKLALLGRTKCYIALGQPELGIVDVDKILSKAKDNYKAIFLKGESLFSAGKFEFALIQYHRGHKLRGDLDDFRLGIQKCHEAIDLALSVNRRPRRHGTAGGQGLSQTAPVGFGESSSGGYGHGSTGGRGGGFSQTQQHSGSQRQQQQQQQQQQDGGYLYASAQQSGRRPSTRGSRGALNSSRGGGGGAGGAGGKAQVLGELSTDKKFLEELLADESLTSRDERISSIASDGLKYLDTRTEFWRQQNPGNASGNAGAVPAGSRTGSRAGSRAANRTGRGGHPRESISRGYQSGGGGGGGGRGGGIHGSGTVGVGSTSGGGGGGGVGGAGGHGSARTPKTIAKQRYLENTRFAMQKLEAINVEMEREDWTSALKMQKSFLSRLNTIELADKGRILGTLYDMMGTTYFNLDKLNLAIIHFRKDLDIAVKEKFKDAFLRALGNLAIVYNKQGEFDQAAVMWEKKLIALDDANEEAELCESIARCYFSSQKYELAIEYGDRGVEAARARGQIDIEMTTTFIVGHAHFNLAQYDKAITCYEAYLELARQQKDDIARADALSALGSAWLQHGEVAKSVALQQEAISISASLQKPPPNVKEQRAVQNGPSAADGSGNGRNGNGRPNSRSSAQSGSAARPQSSHSRASNRTASTPEIYDDV